jgi:hypothetical protein
MKERFSPQRSSQNTQKADDFSFSCTMGNHPRRISRADTAVNILAAKTASRNYFPAEGNTVKEKYFSALYTWRRKNH